MQYTILLVALVLLALIGIEIWQWIEKKKSMGASFSESGTQYLLLTGLGITIPMCLLTTVIGLA